jgi:hypothetical protein
MAACSLSCMMWSEYSYSNRQPVELGVYFYPESEPLVSVRTRNIGEEQSRRLLREVGRKLLTHPFSFLLPGESEPRE